MKKYSFIDEITIDKIRTLVITSIGIFCEIKIAKLFIKMLDN